jgi:hypothetical protein
MIKMESPRNLRFLLLIPCILFIFSAEFARNVKKADFLSATVSGEETSESGGTALFTSENPLLCSQMLNRNKTRLNKLWRQFLSFIIFALLVKPFGKITLQKHHPHNYFLQNFFHVLLISLLLGGRAPPRSV